jgi:hypothetical protein
MNTDSSALPLCDVTLIDQQVELKLKRERVDILHENGLTENSRQPHYIPGSYELENTSESSPCHLIKIEDDLYINNPKARPISLPGYYFPQADARLNEKAPDNQEFPNNPSRFQPKLSYQAPDHTAQMKHMHYMLSEPWNKRGYTWGEYERRQQQYINSYMAGLEYQAETNYLLSQSHIRSEVEQRSQ